MSEPIETEDTQALFAEVVLPLPLKKLYTYRLPSEMFELAVPGKRVFVPFGNRKVYTGIIIHISDKAPERYEALNIISVVDDNPLVSRQQLEFWEWIASYYMCGLGEVMAAALPAGLKMASETYVAPAVDYQDIPEGLDERELKILQILKGKEKIRISEIEQSLKSKTSFVKIIKSLYERQLIVMFEDIPEQYRPRKEKRLRVHPELNEEQINKHLQTLEKKAPVKFNIFLALLAEKGRETVRTEFLRKYKFSSSVLRGLIVNGLIEEFEKIPDPVVRVPEENGFKLTQAQNTALLEIRSHFERKRNVLLHGVAASGKTYIYIELIRECIKHGKSVLYLLPEIAVTEHLLQRLEAFFGSEMMVTHSRFSKNEKVEIWNRVASGEVKLLIGSRSALLMPLQNTGLIIVDEEHETGFKQFEKAPRYQARDAALMFARKCGANVLLGSATPSAETYANALNGKTELVELNEQYVSASPPGIVLADIREEMRTMRMHGIFTDELIFRLKETVEQKGQVILFQNRKGYVPMLECSVCGWVAKCVNCDIALTYYKYSNNLRCHYCGFAQHTMSKCAACGSNTMTIQGYGTERISEELSLLMPALRIIRFDQDSTSKKGAFRKILHDFESGLADVMVGTQIAVKGMDFGNVRLASVIQADHLLNFPDFRSHERTFQLLIQLAGRVGRKGEAGVLVIQTRQPEHPVFGYIVNQDYKGFIRQQLTEREQFAYPPYSKMIRLTLKHRDAGILNQAAAAFAQLLKNQLGSRVLGPETPFVSKIRNMHLRNLLIKMHPERDARISVKNFIEQTFDFMIQRDNLKGLLLIPDVDPY